MAERTTLNFCAGSGCHAGCTHLTHIKDGRIVKVERLIYPDGEEGIICLKGVAGARLPYHPDRLKCPLKRAGKRGEGKWERISWEQALDEIAEKIERTTKGYKPESVAIIPRGNSASPGIQSSLLGDRFMNLLEATNLFHGMPIDSNPIFGSYFSFGMSFGAFADPRTLLEGKTKYMIVWGHNPAEMGPRFMQCITEAQKRGAKLVDVGIIFDETAKKADWWFPVRVGCDTALALAMVHVIINENLYDEDHVSKHTNGPFLVRIDNGGFLRESDILPNGDPQKYMIWDAGSGEAKSIGPGVYEISGVRPSLLGTYKPGRMECKPAFQMLADLAREYLPEKVEGLAGVSSDLIKKLAREYATTKPAAILVCCGLRYKNSGNAYRAINTLGAITGNIGEMGGGTVIGSVTQGGFNAPSLRLNDLAIVFPTEARARSIPLAQSFKCMIHGSPYPIKALIVHFANPLHTIPHPQRWIEEVLPNLDLVVVNDIFMTRTAEYADYVLPDCTIFERDDIDIGYNGHIILAEKAIEPMYECKPPIYFWSELARRLGFGNYFDKTIEEWIEFRLQSGDPSITAVEPPLTLERLRKEKIVRANVAKGIYHPFLDKRFLTPSGRVEIYNEELVPSADGLPIFREPLESPRSNLVEKYPLAFITANNRYFVHTMFANEPSVLKAYKREPHVSINPKDAEERGIVDGDIVVISNERGSCKLKAMITASVPTGVVQLPHGWWPKQFMEGHLANLLLSLASPETRDEAREIYWSVAVRRPSPPALFGEAYFAYSPDTLFDCLCEVKKVEAGEKIRKKSILI